MQQLVLFVQRGIGDGARIGIHVQPHSHPFQPVYRVTVDAVEQIADEIAAGADLEQDAGGYQALDKRSILDAPDAVADARHLQPIQRFPYAVGAFASPAWAMTLPPASRTARKAAT